MAAVEYSLFRASFIKSSQPSLFLDISPRDLFLRAIEERPSGEARRGHIWHIGNLQRFSDTAGYFAIGRTTKSTIEKFDTQSRNFSEEELETSPYTHCVFDAAIGIIGIARKSSLSPTVRGIATRIQELLLGTDIIRSSHATVEIKPIPNPEDFLLAIETAYRVSRFGATFRGPNPFDADEYFQKPLSIYLAEAHGEKGNAEIKGQDLDRGVLISVSRSTAATGNEAAATVTRDKGERSIRVHLRGDAVKRAYDEEEHDPRQVLEDLIALYHEVRKR